MKKFFAIVALAAAMFTVNSSVANAQNWDDFNYRLKVTHTKDYIQKGDDEFRMGQYEKAMDSYKRAREYNEYKGHTVVPAQEIERKMDRCAEAIRFGYRPSSSRREEVSDAGAIVAGVAILGGIIANAVSSKKEAPAQAAPAQAAKPTQAVQTSNSNALCEVACNGLVYTTKADNKACRVRSIKNEGDFTVVEMQYFNLNNHSTDVWINADTYLKDRNANRIYSPCKFEAIYSDKKLNVMPSDSHIFRIYYDRISDECSQVDVIEPGSSNWKFYNVPVSK